MASTAFSLQEYTPQLHWDGNWEDLSSAEASSNQPVADVGLPTPTLAPDLGPDRDNDEFMAMVYTPQDGLVKIDSLFAGCSMMTAIINLVLRGAICLKGDLETAFGKGLASS
ncbi:hypothetical protein FIBSPDRAFT_897427 [Athelia psychrophila]|uniref:Uncharacterized protein n=1 Tax=Athelia psychrophila TaxID=1759441 RepID=A0A166C870_9AGAM|nr:hypothetical protein FIBSPDRAFT_897427 [Fibularhizoctonia sp. CBS 109695]